MEVRSLFRFSFFFFASALLHRNRGFNLYFVCVFLRDLRLSVLGRMDAAEREAARLMPVRQRDKYVSWIFFTRA